MKKVILHIVFTIALIAAWPLQAKAAEFILNADSLVRITKPAKKMECHAMTPWGKNQLTVFYDSIGQPLLITTVIDYPKVNTISVDTTLVKPNLDIVYMAEFDIKKGDTVNYEIKDYEIFSLAHPRWPVHYTPGEFDNDGNWIKSKGDNTTITRKISHTLTPAEEAMVKRYQAMFDQRTFSFIPEPVRLYWPFVGLLIIAFAAFRAVTIVRNSHRRTIKKLTVDTALTTAIGCAGMFLLTLVDFPSLGWYWLAGVSAVGLLAINVFLGEIGDELADDRRLSNDNVNDVFGWPAFILFLTGLCVGLAYWQNLLIALIPAIVYVVPAMTPMVSNDDRCPSCHKRNSIVEVERINCGIHTETTTSVSKHRGPWKEKEVYGTDSHYHERATATDRHTVTETIVRYQKYRIKKRCTNCGYETTSPVYRERISSERNQSHFDKQVERELDVRRK